MNANEVKQLEAEVAKAKLAEAGVTTPVKESPLGFEFKTGGRVSMDREQFYYIVGLIRPFQTVARILDEAQNEAVRAGEILPFYRKDVLKEQKDLQGQLIGYTLKEGWDTPVAKVDNAVNLVDLQGTTLKSN